jgi:hypothetical protein
VEEKMVLMEKEMEVASHRLQILAHNIQGEEPLVKGAQEKEVGG